MSVSDEKVKEHIAKDIRANADRNPEVDDLGELLTNYAESQQCECGGTKYLVDDTVEGEQVTAWVCNECGTSVI